MDALCYHQWLAKVYYPHHDYTTCRQCLTDTYDFMGFASKGGLWMVFGVAPHDYGDPR